MKTKGLRKSKNIQDVRGPTSGYAKPSALSAARDSRKNQAFWDGKGATASKGKMAKAAGADAVNGAAWNETIKDLKKKPKGKR